MVVSMAVLLNQWLIKKGILMYKSDILVLISLVKLLYFKEMNAWSRANFIDKYQTLAGSVHGAKPRSFWVAVVHSVATGIIFYVYLRLGIHYSWISKEERTNSNWFEMVCSAAHIPKITKTINIIAKV